jgi:hypothetical protein
LIRHRSYEILPFRILKHISPYVQVYVTPNAALMPGPIDRPLQRLVSPIEDSVYLSTTNAKPAPNLKRDVWCKNDTITLTMPIAAIMP